MTATLANAVRADIAIGNTMAGIRPDKWGETYHCTTEDVRTAWEAETARASLPPDNMYEGEGK